MRVISAALILSLVALGAHAQPFPISQPTTFRGESGKLGFLLNLYPDTTFRLRIQGLHPSPAYDIGRWQLASNGKELIARGSTAVDHTFTVVSPDELRHPFLRDPLRLTRLPEFQEIEPTFLLLRGEFTYLADAATFRECASGLTFPVAMEAAYIDTERAYTQLNPAGRPVIVHVNASLATRLAGEGPNSKQALVIHQLLGVRPDQSCPPSGVRSSADADLRNTHWRVTSIFREPVVTSPNQRDAHIVLRQDQRVTGYSGCNQLTGSYVVTDQSIELSRVALTRRACLPGNDTEPRLTKALGATRGWRIQGQQLELLDASGSQVATFEAVDPK